MNYYIMQFIRYILAIICSVIVIKIKTVYLKKRSKEGNTKNDTSINTTKDLYSKKKDKKFSKINYIICLIIFIVIFVLPLDSLIKHKTIEEAFHYNYPNYKIRKEYAYDDCAYIMYSHHGENGFAYLVKEKNYWKLIENQNTETQHYQSFTIVTYKNDSYNNSCRNKAGIFVIKAPDEAENFKITDSKSSEFETFVMKNKLSPTSTFISKATLIDGVDEDYTIFLNDYVQLKPFQ